MEIKHSTCNAPKNTHKTPGGLSAVCLDTLGSDRTKYEVVGSFLVVGAEQKQRAVRFLGEKLLKNDTNHHHQEPK